MCDDVSRLFSFMASSLEKRTPFCPMNKSNQKNYFFATEIEDLPCCGRPIVIVCNIDGRNACVLFLN